MKNLALGIIAAIGLSTAAQAADMAVKARPAPIVAAQYNWSGFYAGVNGGWADENLFWAYNPPVVGGLRQTNAFNWSSGVIGVHGGAQYQMGNFVLGVEGGYIWNDNSWQAFTCPNPALLCQARLNDLWTVGPRLGYAWDRVMVYGTGGYASGNVATQVGTVVGIGLTEFSSVRQDGWFGGVGVEYAAYVSPTADIIVGAEYTHIELNRSFHCVTGPGFGCTIPSVLNRDVDGHVDMIRARLSVKFNPWGRAVVAKY